MEQAVCVLIDSAVFRFSRSLAKIAESFATREGARGMNQTDGFHSYSLHPCGSGAPGPSGAVFATLAARFRGHNEKRAGAKRQVRTTRGKNLYSGGILWTSRSPRLIPSEYGQMGVALRLIKRRLEMVNQNHGKSMVLHEFLGT